MIVVGLTGGIGSGKTTVAQFFKLLGIPVYVADKEAKALMNRSKVIKRQLIALFGDKAYVNNILNREYLAECIFNNKVLLDKMNAIVHPKVASHFKHWLNKQDAPYIIKEAAIIFENNLESSYDYIITVVADEEQRIQRVIQRDSSNREKVKSIIKNQWSDEEKMKRSDFVIFNNDLEKVEEQVSKIHKTILSEIP
jgi:dephospho-CoA kinase